MLMRPSTTLYVFAAYLSILAAVLLFVPNMLLGVFGLGTTNEVWIRVVGMLALFLAIYQARMARENNRVFFETSVYLRASVIVIFTIFVLLDLAPLPLILFGVVDLLGAAWTFFALQKEQPVVTWLRGVQNKINVK